MPREKEGFREVLERLDERYPEKEVLSQPEVADFIGKTTRFVRARMKNCQNKQLGGYPKVKIAKELVK